MKAAWIAWWRLRSVREQRLLLVMTALMAVVLAWLLVIRPMDNALLRARMRHGAAVLALAQARGQADAIRALERLGPPPPQIPIETFLTQKASEAGFTAAHVEPGGADRATFAIDAVRPGAFFSWLADLDRRDGVIVDTLAVHTNADASLAVQATFRVRGR